MAPWLCYSIILALLLFIVWALSNRTCLLRNTVFDRDSFHALKAAADKPNAKESFSWGRVQFAFWTIIIIGSAIYVWIFKCGCSGATVSMTLDPVNLGLLGVSIATTAIGKVIDGSQQDQPTADTVAAQQNHPSNGFLTDILSDDNGISIHRLQNVLWTAVVGYIYVSHVFEKCEMPDHNVISGTMIGLM